MSRPELVPKGDKGGHFAQRWTFWSSGCPGTLIMTVRLPRDVNNDRQASRGVFLVRQTSRGVFLVRQTAQGCVPRAGNAAQGVSLERVTLPSGVVPGPGSAPGVPWGVYRARVVLPVHHPAALLLAVVPVLHRPLCGIG